VGKVYYHNQRGVGEQAPGGKNGEGEQSLALKLQPWGLYR